MIGEVPPQIKVAEIISRVAELIFNFKFEIFNLDNFYQAVKAEGETNCRDLGAGKHTNQIIIPATRAN